MARVRPLRNRIQNYPWGSRTGLARFLGRAAPSEEPEAELWMGAHPGAPSQIEIDGRWVALDEAIRRAPQEMLGPETAARYDSTLPFLFKVLAADRALSIQAHPDRGQAVAGCRKEDARGIPRQAAGRSYRDPRHKPEILYAVEPFSILRGFRPPAEILELMERLDLPRWLPEPCAALAAGDLKGFFTAYLAADPREVLRVVLPQIDAADDEDGPFAWVLELARQCPGDRGVLAPLFLHLLELQPGQAIFTGPGVLHAYLAGVGVELMANSDNVVRGGLTGKHVDVGELLAILRFVPDPPRLLRSSERGGVRRFETVAEELDLSVITVREKAPREQSPHGVEILLCAGGEGRLEEAGEAAPLAFGQGDSFFVPAAVGGYRIAGHATLFRAGVP